MSAKVTEELDVDDVTLRPGESIVVRLSEEDDHTLFEIFFDGHIQVWTEGGKQLMGEVNLFKVLE